jgi:hypothetical protein
MDDDVVGKHVGDCRLCGKTNVVLCDSHVMPKWAYRRARDSSNGRATENPIMILDGIAHQTSQQITEYLLCFACEQRLGRDEKYVAGLACQPDGKLGLEGLLDPVTAVKPRGSRIVSHMQAFQTTGLDCRALARFAASVFWRAHVARRTETSALFLWTPQAEALRRFVVGEKPLPERMCLSMWALTEAGRFETPFSRSFSMPATKKKGHDSHHMFVISGLVFSLSTGAESQPSLCLLCGSPPPLLAQDWRNIGLTRSGAAAVVSAETKGRGATRMRAAAMSERRRS